MTKRLNLLRQQLRLWFFGRAAAEQRANMAESRADMMQSANIDLADTLQGRERELADLGKTLQELTVEKQILADRLEQALSDRTRNWDLMREALAGEREALHMQVNYATQQRFGVAPYADAPKLPDAMIPHPQEGGPLPQRMTASQAVQRQSREFVNQFIGRVKSAAK